MPQTDAWTRIDRSGLRATRPQREGSWFRLRRKHHFLCIPPRGAVLPWGIFEPLVKVPIVDLAETPMKDANREETLVRVFVDDAALWLDETFGPKLSTMLEPHTGHHDFIVLCGGLPLRVMSGDGRWSAHFTLRREFHEIRDYDLEGLTHKIRRFFLQDFSVDMPVMRLVSFLDEATTAEMRQELMLEAVRCETLPVDADPDAIQQATRRALANCETMKTLRRRDVMLHREALGLRDPKDRKLRQDFGSLAELMTAAKRGA